ncbi:hypothetical protein H180DRAFT_02080 [Streptomyces sp. WMMB 322]|nr:hypothetical protein H180DRAFT_02080 [Streptomyces sp. WMMB 322]
MTATAAGAVLCALWFVPSARAAPDTTGPGGAHPSATSYSGASSAPHATDAAADRARRASAAEQPGDGVTSPFFLSALGVAGAGGAMILRARRRKAG